MNNVNNDRYKNILGTIIVVKFSILFVALLIVINDAHQMSDILNVISLNNYLMFLAPSFLIIIAICWCFYNLKIFGENNSNVFFIIEDCVYIISLLVLILLSSTYKSQYKYLFIFSIISATISLGKKYGLIIAAISSSIVLLVDLYFGSNLVVNIYFENDLMLSLGFFMIAWALGEYKKFESNQREVLEMELYEQSKKHNYIEEMLLKNDDCYNMLIRNSHYAIIIHCDNKILYSNKHALHLFGAKTFYEISENSISDFEYIDEKTKSKEIYLDILANQKANISFEEKVVDINGKIINIENTSTSCVYEKKSAILTIMRDITHQKQIKKLEEVVIKNTELLNQTKEYNKFITEFFSNISHELKTPINIIFSSLQLLNMYNDSSNIEIIKKRKIYLVGMKQNCYRLIRLVNNLLDMTKYDSGFITLHLKNENIVYVVEDITTSILPYSESKGIKVIFDTNVEEKIMAFDGDKIERIVLNLLSNALKFTNKGGEIYVDIMDKKDTVEISVRDTGIGISDDQKELIFGRFMQVDKTFKRNREGTGIGLSLVKSFVELHGGTIKLISKLNEGSKFTVNLPVIKVNEENEAIELKEDMTERVNMELSDIYSDIFTK